jgi:uncharacterized protein YggE
MKYIFAGLILSLFTLSTAYAVDGNFPARTSKSDTITIAGTGSLEIAPEIATISLAITTRSQVSSEAQSQNAIETKRLTDALTQRYGLQKNQITTTSYTLTQELDPNNPNVVIGYVVRHNLAISVNFVDGLGEFLDLATASGATSIEYIQFGLKDQKAYELQALRLSMQDAHTKASAIADSVGRRIIRVVKVSEGEYSSDSGRRDAQTREPGTEIFPSPITITATLTVTYAF